MIAILGLAVLLGSLLALTAWWTWRGNSSHRSTVAGWSTRSMVLWSLGFGVAALVNHPIPPQAHHLDRYWFGLLGCLVWSGWFLAGPQSMARALESRPARWTNAVLMNLLIFILAGEATVRLADPLLARSSLFGDKHTLAHLKPHVPVRGSIGQSNAQGFRDRERTVGRTLSAPRVLALGDSFTWGAGVSYDEAFVTLLERRLRAYRTGTEVINVGVPAWGPEEEFHLLKAYGIRLQPDLVMLNFFIGNDIQNKRGDDLALLHPMVVAGQIYYVHSNGNWFHDRISPDRWFLYHDLNYLLRIGSARFEQVFDGKEAHGPVSLSSGEAAPLVSHAYYVRGIYERSDIYRADETPFFARHWARTQRILLGLRDYLSERGVSLLIVVIPDHVQLDRALQREYLAGTGQAGAEYDFYKPQRLLLAWCREQGIATVDLLPAFEAAGSPERLYFQNDFHLTAQGHRLAAELIEPSLQAKLAVLGPSQERKGP